VSLRPQPRSWQGRHGPQAAHATRSLVVTLVALAGGWALIQEAAALPGWVVALGLACCVLLGFVGGRAAYGAIRRLADAREGTVLSLGPDGLFDRRLAPVPIPWKEIARLRLFHRPAPVVRFDLTPRGEALLFPDMRRMARLGRWLGRPGCSVAVMGLGGAEREVAEAVQAWHAAMGAPGGKAGADRT